MASKLGGLPDLGYGPAFTEQAPVPHNDQAGSVWNALADTAQKIGDLFQPELDARAAKMGEAAVTRDAQGNLQFTGDRIVLTKADAAYMNAAQLRYMSEAALDIRPKIAELQLQHMGDPQGFAASLDGFITGQTQNAPEAFQAPLTEMILKEGTSAQDAIIRQKLSSDVTKSQQSVDALYQANVNELTGYARENKLDDPRAVDLLNQVTQLLRAKVHNPLFAYSQEQADQDISELQSTLRGEAIVGHVDDLYRQYGEAEAETRLKALVDDPALNLKPAERQQFYGQGLQEIRQLHAMKNDEERELRMDVETRIDDATAAALATGDYSSVVTPDEINRAYSSNPARAAQIIGRLNAATEIHSMNQAVANATPSDLAAMEQKYRPTAQNLGQTGGGPPPGSVAAQNLANNNPGNLRVPGQKTFQKFATPQEGIRAVDNQIGLYIKRGTDTITGIVSTYAPASDNNDTASYIASVSRQTGIAPDATVTASDIPKIRDAMIRVEQGGTPVANHPDVADQLRIYTAFHQAVAARNQALNSDPAGFIIKGHADIAAMLQSKDPAIAQKGDARLLMTERDFGVAEPQLLSKSAVQTIIASFNNAPDPTKKADAMVSTIGALEQRYGSNYPAVMRQLIKGGLPNEAIALDFVKDDPVVAARMANAVNTGRSDLLKLVPDSGDVNKSVLQGLADFNGTTRGFGGSQVSSQVAQATQLYAYQLVAEGVDPDKAASQAVADMIGKHYTFQDGYRVPAGIDTGEVSAGASAALDQLQGKNIEPYGPADPGATLEDRQRMAADILKSQGQWVTLPDDSGLALVWPAQTGFLQARTANKQPIRYTWAQLSAMSHHAPAAFNWGALIGFGGPQ